LAKTKSRSIAFRLIAAVLAVELVSSVAVIFLSLGYERHTHFRAFDIMLRGRADSVLGAVQDAEDTGDNVMLDMADLHVPPDDVYEVWDGRGHLLGRSANWLGSAGMATPQRNGYARFVLGQRPYRLLRMQGSRIVDPGETGGGHLRFVTILYGSPTDHVWGAIRGAVEFYAAGSLLLLLVTGPLIAWLLHRGLEPLRQLAALASQVSVDAWEFSPPASARTTRELAPLTQAIESVLQRLQHSFTRQRTFVSDAAHELKTAVAVVKSSLQLLGLRQRTASEYQAGLARCVADSDRLEELVAKMLTLARLENASEQSGPNATNAPRPAVCDITECVRNAVDELGTVAAFRGMRIAISEMAGEDLPIPLAAGDCTLLISNLLLNALQHSSAKSMVTLRLTSWGQAIELVIDDQGEGISPEALPHVFERFYRGDPSRTRSTGGAGLGLAICKAMVEKAGGTIAITSQQGEGTTVTVRLPVASGVSAHPPGAFA
jgi:signal transduction histidine kinase